MTENPDVSADLTEEASADEAERRRDPARHAITHRASGQTGRDLTRRLVERFSTPAADDAVDGAI